MSELAEPGNRFEFVGLRVRERISSNRPFADLVDSLAAIHDIDPETVGLEEFGYPEGYTRRQVTWTEQL